MRSDRRQLGSKGSPSAMPWRCWPFVARATCHRVAPVQSAPAAWRCCCWRWCFARQWPSRKRQQSASPLRLPQASVSSPGGSNRAARACATCACHLPAPTRASSAASPSAPSLSPGGREMAGGPPSTGAAATSTWGWVLRWGGSSRAATSGQSASRPARFSSACWTYGQGARART
jgi:hypothetical protein